MIIKGFGVRLRWLRDKETQKELGLQVGASQRYISQLENEERGPSVSMLIALCDYYEVTMDFLTLRNDDIPLSKNELPVLRSGTQ